MYQTLLFALLHVGGGCDGQAPSVVRAAIEAGERYNVPPRVLLAVVMAETRCRNLVSRRRHNGGRDVGYAQIHLKPSKLHLTQRYLNPRHNLRRAALILSRSRAFCERTQHPRCKRSIWLRYNWRSRTWWTKVRRYLHKIERHMKRAAMVNDCVSEQIRLCTRCGEPFMPTKYSAKSIQLWLSKTGRVPEQKICGRCVIAIIMEDDDEETDETTAGDP